MTTRPSVILFIVLAGGCGPEDPTEAGAHRVLVEAECASLIARGDVSKGVELAKAHKIHGVALLLLAQLAAEPDYWRGCELTSDLCDVTGIDIPYGCSVPEDHQALWAQMRLRYWTAWLHSREGRSFLEGGTSKPRSFYGDDDLAAFLDQMSGNARNEGPPHGSGRFDDDH